MNDVQSLFADFVIQTHFFWIFAAWNCDMLSGTIISVKNRCWNSQTAKHGLLKFLSYWFPTLILDYIARKSGVAGGAAFGSALEAYIIYVEIGSTLENLGYIHNDSTVMNLGTRVVRQASDTLAQQGKDISA